MHSGTTRSDGFPRRRYLPCPAFFPQALCEIRQLTNPSSAPLLFNDSVLPPVLLPQSLQCCLSRSKIRQLVSAQELTPRHRVSPAAHRDSHRLCGVSLFLERGNDSSLSSSACILVSQNLGVQPAPSPHQISRNESPTQTVDVRTQAPPSP